MKVHRRNPSGGDIFYAIANSQNMSDGVDNNRIKMSDGHHNVAGPNSINHSGGPQKVPSLPHINKGVGGASKAHHGHGGKHTR